VSAGATAAAPAVDPRRTAVPAPPLTVPRRPRRVSGPARKIDDRPARRRAKGESGLGLLAALGRLTRRRTLGGRTWIALVAFALIGIVTLQLGLLKLNGGIGRALEHEAVLQRENAALSIENSELAASDRVTSWAVRLGMGPVPPAALRFLKVRPWLDPARAAGALGTSIHAPTAGAGEGLAGSSSAQTSPSASAQQSSAGAVAPSASSEPSTTSTTTAPAEPSTTGSATSSASGESSGRGPAEPARTAVESTKSPATASPTAPATSPPAEATPAGGTPAGSSG
jgi:hypothetical protein